MLSLGKPKLVSSRLFYVPVQGWAVTFLAPPGDTGDLGTSHSAELFRAAGSGGRQHSEADLRAGPQQGRQEDLAMV